MTKRLILVMVALLIPFVLGLLFTYDVIKIDWVSLMEIQPSFRPQSAPLPLPAQSVPVQGAAFVADLGAPVNPVPADPISIARGKQLYVNACLLCHGADGKGGGPFAAFLTTKPPANLMDDDIVANSDGDFFVVISSGIPGQMPSLRENLPSARDRWDVVNYVRSLQGK
jgi:mono/diheme cytochrome c family protein